MLPRRIRTQECSERPGVTARWSVTPLSHPVALDAPHLAVLGWRENQTVAALREATRDTSAQTPCQAPVKLSVKTRPGGCDLVTTLIKQKVKYLPRKAEAALQLAPIPTRIWCVT